MSSSPIPSSVMDEFDDFELADKDPVLNSSPPKKCSPFNVFDYHTWLMRERIRNHESNFADAQEILKMRNSILEKQVEMQRMKQQYQLESLWLMMLR
ncbi:hypothetical protein ACET3Z_032129 [Daucus carota]